MEGVDVNENVYRVDTLLARKKIKGHWHYLVKWEGFDDDHNLWVSSRDINKDLVQEFKLQLKTKRHQKKVKIAENRMKNNEDLLLVPEEEVIYAFYRFKMSLEDSVTLSHKFWSFAVLSTMILCLLFIMFKFNDDYNSPKVLHQV